MREVRSYAMRRVFAREWWGLRAAECLNRLVFEIRQQCCEPDGTELEERRIKFCVETRESEQVSVTATALGCEK